MVLNMTANAEVAQTPDPPGLYTNYASKSSFVLAGIQITIGVSTSLLTIAVFAGFFTEIIISLLCGAIVSTQCSVQLYNMRHCKCTVKSIPLRNSKHGMMSDKWIVIPIHKYALLIHSQHYASTCQLLQCSVTDSKLTSGTARNK